MKIYLHNFIMTGDGGIATALKCSFDTKKAVFPA
jgi:hypothetical protein